MNIPNNCDYCEEEPLVGEIFEFPSDDGPLFLCTECMEELFSKALSGMALN